MDFFQPLVKIMAEEHDIKPYKLSGKNSCDFRTSLGGVSYTVSFDHRSRRAATMLYFYGEKIRNGGCAATALYSGLIEAYPIMAIEAVWTLVALQRFLNKRRTLTIAQT